MESLNKILQDFSLNVNYANYTNKYQRVSFILNDIKKLRYLEVIGSPEESVKQISDYEYDIYMKLNVPFHVKPIKDDQFPGFVMLFAGDGVEHKAVVNGYVNRKALEDWLKLENGGSLKIQKVINEVETTFNIKPVFEFNYTDWVLPEPGLPDIIYKTQPWYALPQAVVPFDSRTFLVWMPHWENMLMRINNSQNVFYIMKELCYVNQMSELSDEILKKVILKQLPLKSSCTLVDFLIDMWRKLCDYLKEANLPNFVLNNLNQFRHLKEETIEAYLHEALNILASLEKCKAGSSQALKQLGGIMLYRK
ncbi:cyclic GMP-AMP synthase-like protein [Drosophila montana]|uniref:cyclic GMP-AMP synthase-like protein n=1 Tax=Drosophila montana TaxID=40370 RepID=UPI00313AB290